MYRWSGKFHAEIRRPARRDSFLMILRNQSNRSKAYRPGGLREQRQRREQVGKFYLDQGGFKGTGNREETEMLCTE